MNPCHYLLQFSFGGHIYPYTHIRVLVVQRCMCSAHMYQVAFELYCAYCTYIYTLEYLKIKNLKRCVGITLAMLLKSKETREKISSGMREH